MFRLQDNMPQVYTEQSRDFQLFCRLYDCINNGVKFDIDTMINILDPYKTNDIVLPLLCAKVGFFPKNEYNSNILRNIISIFPYCIKHKGTKQGILSATYAILKGENNVNEAIQVDINQSNYSISINTQKPIINQKALEDVLSYIIPTGYFYTTDIYKPTILSDKVSTKNIINTLQNPSSNSSQIRGSDRYLQTGNNINSFQFQTDIENNYIATFQDTEVIGSENNLVKNTYNNDISGSLRNTIDEHSENNIEEINY